MINTFYERSLNVKYPMLTKNLQAELSKAMLSHRYIFVLYVRILPDPEKESYDSFHENEKIMADKWYNNFEEVGRIRYLYVLTISY